MKVGIIIPIHNRPSYLKDTLWSLERVILPVDTVILLINDASRDQQAINLFNNFTHPTALIQRDNFQTNQGIRGALLHGYETLFGLFNCDLVINFDSDAVIRPDAVTKLIDAYGHVSQSILTGFHCTTKNSNGTDRHKILGETEVLKLYHKESVGGINLCIDEIAYQKYVKPALLIPGNWDHNACLNTKGICVFSLRESVVQHIGFESSMNHNEQPDVADDFYYWNLPDVTLIGVDNDLARLNAAKEKCTKWIKFGSVVMLDPGLKSKEAYSEYCINELYKSVSTSHMLIFQHDGFVNNWKAWDNDWLQYDYIGAPWHYVDGMAVGNGGFSLRSRRLMEIVATDPHIKITHPEDHHICRTYRPYLEAAYGIKFAPSDVADKFGFEGYLQPSKVLKDQFGVHGNRVRLHPQPKIANRKYIFLQFFGLGDILFLVPLARALMAEGNEVVWPIADYYFSIAKHFPDINFVCKSSLKINYDSRHRIPTQHGEILPYRYAAENLGVGFDRMMRAKYDLYHHDYRMWRSLEYARFPNKERQLAEKVGATGKYIVVNNNFGQPQDNLGKQIPVQSEFKIIQMQNIEGYTLIDWLGVIENAQEVHLVNSSLMYLLELLPLDIPVHVYPRLMFGERSFEFTSYLWESNKFIYHENT